MFFTDTQIFLTLHGVPRLCTEGLHVYYYTTPLNLLQDSGDIYENANYFLVDIEQSELDKLNTLSMDSHVLSSDNPTIENPFEYSNSPNTSNLPLQYTITLFPPVLLSMGSLKQILYPSQNFGNITNFLCVFNLF
jgi:hypothetical protein